MRPSLEGNQIAEYVLCSHIARGGMSEIYLAKHLGMTHQVAMKLVHQDQHEFYERFRREVEVMASLEHDHILPAFDYGVYGPWYYMVMPYIAHGTLRDRLARGALPQKVAGMFLMQVASALQFAHDRDLLHRDIKPSNMLLRDGEHVYLSDFGLVKRMTCESSITQTGMLIGTPEYMAPELAENIAIKQSDIYALGVVLYQMLTGSVPFKSQTPMGVCWKHIRELPTPPSVLNPAVSRPVERVVLRALAKDPYSRFQSAAEFADAYRQAIMPRSVQVYPLLATHAQTRREVITGSCTQPLRITTASNRKKRRTQLSPRLVAATMAAVLMFCVVPTLFGAAVYRAEMGMLHAPASLVNVAANSLLKGDVPAATSSRTVHTPSLPPAPTQTTGYPNDGHVITQLAGQNPIKPIKSPVVHALPSSDSEDSSLPLTHITISIPSFENVAGPVHGRNGARSSILMPVVKHPIQEGITNGHNGNVGHFLKNVESNVGKLRGPRLGGAPHKQHKAD